MSYSKKINLVVLQNAINISWRNPRKWQWRCRAWNIHKVKRSTWYYAHDIITQAALNTPVQLRNYRFYCTYCMYISLNVNSRPIKHTRKQQNSKLVLQPLLNVTHVSQHTTDQKKPIIHSHHYQSALLYNSSTFTTNHSNFCDSVHSTLL